MAKKPITAPEKSLRRLRITAKPQAGFYRCGRHHPFSTVDHPAGTFTDDEIEILQDEPMLVVQELEAVPVTDPASPPPPPPQ